MKEKLRKVLRFFRIDVLLFTLYAKIALAVIKKLTAFKNAIHGFLTRLFPRNGKKVCSKSTAMDTADTVTTTIVVNRAENTATVAVTNSFVDANATDTIATP